MSSSPGTLSLGTSITLRQAESPAGLVFDLACCRKKPWLALALALGTAAVSMLWQRSGMEVPLELSLLAVISLAGALRTRKAHLQVDEHGITATGHLGGSKPGTLQLLWSSIREIHYAPAGRGEIGGLYAREGAWCSRCILPRISEPQAEEVISAIAQRYPSLVPFRNNVSNGALRSAQLPPPLDPAATTRHSPARRSRWLSRHAPATARPVKSR